MAIRDVLGTVVLLVFLGREAEGRLTNSEAEAVKESQSRSVSNSAQYWSNQISQSSVLPDPTNAEAFFALGFSNYGHGDFDEAVTLLEKSISLRPTNYEANLYLGYAHYHLKQFDAATVALRAAAQCQPAKADAHHWLGASLYRLDRYDEATKVLKRALALDPNQPHAWYVLGCCRYSLKAYPGAAESFQRAALKEPTNYLAHVWAGYSLIGAARFGEAAASFHNAVTLCPDDYDANFWRAICLMRMWQFQNAIPNLEQALKGKPNDRSAREFLFACYLFTGQLKKIRPLHFGILIPILVFLVVSYVPATAWLFRRSMRPGMSPAPGLGFASAWWGVTMLGQTLLVLAPLVLFSWSVPQSLGVGVILSGLPLIVAAIGGFARQPWGTAFVWSKHGLGRKVVFSALVAVSLVAAIIWGYTALMRVIRGRPMPDQFIVEWLGHDPRSWPWSVFIGVAVVGPITEEILFRGLLYAAINKRLSAGWTIVVTAVLFTLIHLQPIFFVPIFALGLVLGWARHRSQSLVLPVIIHCLSNGVALLLESHR